MSIAVAFILSSLAIFGFAYVRMSMSLQANDRNLIQLKLKEYTEEFEEGGVMEVRRALETDSMSGGLRGFVFRVAGPQNETLFLQPPQEGINYDFSRLEQVMPQRGEWIRLKGLNKNVNLDIASTGLEGRGFLPNRERLRRS